MINSIQNYGVTPAKVAFTSKKDVNRDNQLDNREVYKTHAGLKTGIGYAVVEGGLAGFFATGASFMKNVMKQQGPEFMDNAKAFGKASKTWFIYIPVAILTALGCGALVDKKINNKHIEFADKLETEGKKKVLKNDDNAELTRKGEVYYHTSIGKKMGPVLGLVLTPLLSLAKTKVAGGKISVLETLINVGAGALGGLILGAITDKVANKGAAKFADKQAMTNDEV